MLKLVTALASALDLVLYLVLVHRDPTYKLLSPRGGIVPQIISMLIANAMVWASQQPEREASTRFQLFMAAWIWIVVQIGCTIYTINEGVSSFQRLRSAGLQSPSVISVLPNTASSATNVSTSIG